MSRLACARCIVALLLVALPGHTGAETKSLFENERVIAWRVAPGAALPVRDQRLPGVMVTLADGAVRIVDDVSVIAARDLPASDAILVAIKNSSPGKLEIPPGLIPAFPREGARRVTESDRVAVWDVSWTKGYKTPPHFHDKDVVAVYLGAGTVRSVALSGETTATPRLAGDTVFLPRGRAHIEECIDGPRRDIIIELK
jgi:hypothetical protein